MKSDRKDPEVDTQQVGAAVSVTQEDVPSEARPGQKPDVEAPVSVWRTRALRAATVALAVTLGVGATWVFVQRTVAAWSNTSSGPAIKAASSAHAQEGPGRRGELDSAAREAMHRRWQLLHPTSPEAALVEGQGAPPNQPSPPLKSRGAASSAEHPAAYRAYEIFDGPAHSYQATARRRPQPSQRPSGPSGVAVRGRGTRLRARLLDEVSSEPGGAPFIARLLQGADLGDLQLAPNTEIHGTTVAHVEDDGRVHLRTAFLRTPKGDTEALGGWVRDHRGRMGLAGVPVLEGHKMGRAGRSAAARLARRAGRAIARASGPMVGAGLDEASDLALEGSPEPFRSTASWVVPRGTQLQVYVDCVASGCP